MGNDNIVGLILYIENKEKGLIDTETIAIAVPAGKSESQELSVKIPLNAEISALVQIVKDNKFSTCSDEYKQQVEYVPAQASGKSTPESSSDIA